MTVVMPEAGSDSCVCACVGSGCRIVRSGHRRFYIGRVFLLCECGSAL